MTLCVTVTVNRGVKRPPPCTVMPALAVSVLCVTALSTSASCVRRGPSGIRALPDAAALGRAGWPARGCAVGVDAGVAQRQYADVCDAAGLDGRGSCRRRGGHAVAADDAVADRHLLERSGQDSAVLGVRVSGRGRRGDGVAGEARVAYRVVCVELAGAFGGVGAAGGAVGGGGCDAVVADRTVT